MDFEYNLKLVKYPYCFKYRWIGGDIYPIRQYKWVCKNEGCQNYECIVLRTENYSI
jgi:hypothetical protein